MSCNGCRVLRKGCNEECMLRHCLTWIENNPEAQGYATLFVAKFFGRANLMSFLSSVPINHRSALFQSLLYEAVGRTINPVDGAVGLLSAGNWHLCQLAVEKVLRGGAAALMDTATSHHHQAVVMKRKQVSFDDYFLKEAESQERIGGGHHHLHHQSKKQRASSPPSNQESDTTTFTTTTHHSPSQTTETKLLTLFF